jgi:hypothetical protein
MRQREWEWFQHRDAVIDASVLKTYHEVIGIHLGTPLSREWWNTIGRAGLNQDFVAAVDEQLADLEPRNYFDLVQQFGMTHGRQSAGLE